MNKYALNEAIEKATGDYVNPIVYLLKDTVNDGKEVPEHVITSLDSLLYQYSQRNLINKISLIPRVQTALLESNVDEKTDLVIIEASNTINSSPVVDFEMIVYRGLTVDLQLAPGQFFTHKSFLFCSLHESFASMFLWNTTNCYKVGGSFEKAEWNAGVGTMLKIRVPPNTHYYETKIDFNYPHSGPRSEIVLDRDTILQVQSVEPKMLKDGTKYNLVTATVVPSK